MLDTAKLEPSEADRYALAFRPSWAPLVQEPQPAAADKIAPTPKQAEREPREEPLALPGRKTRRRGSLLASASVLSFVGLVYWGVSSSTPSAEHVAQLGKPASTQPKAPQSPVARQNAEAYASATDRPSDPPALAPTSDLSALKARPQGAAAPSPEAPAAAPAPATETETETATLPASSAESAAPHVAEAPAAPEQPAPAPAAAATEPVAAAPQRPAVEASAPVPAVAAAPTPPAAHNDVAPAPVATSAAKPAAPAIAAAAPKPAAPPVAAPSSTAPAARPVVASAAPAKAAAPLTAAPAQPSAIAMAQPTHPAPAEPAPQHKHMPLLSVRAMPEGARLFLDGQRLPNPFDMRLPEGGKHKLEARFEGYESSSQTVRIESDAKLTISLRRLASEPQLQVRPLNQQQAPHGAGFVTSNPY